jgi:hypothetical protein
MIYDHHLFAQHVHMNEMKLLFNLSAEQGLHTWNRGYGKLNQPDYIIL